MEVERPSLNLSSVGGPMSAAATSFSSAWTWEARDRRVDEWPLMGSIWPTLAICSAYVFLVKVLGPALMRDREAYELKGLMKAYNVFQVCGSFFVFSSFMKNGWFMDYSYVCEPVTFDPDPSSKAFQMAGVVWIAYLFRFIDFIDTFFFVARKKFSHVSTLQVLHHFLTPIYAWAICRYYPGGNATFGAMLNFFVHTVMYFYYLVASLGPTYAPYLWWKRHLTTFQISIFVVSFVHSFANLVGATDCGFPWQMSLLSVLMFALMFVLFAEFYQQAYLNKNKGGKSKTN